MHPVPIKAREFRYAVDLSEEGALRAEDGTRLAEGEPSWTPEHLLLGALLRCTVKSLEHHARIGRIEVFDVHGSARALFTRRAEDDRYAAVDTQVALTVRLEPMPGPDGLSKLLALAERDCFVGASLAASPTYNWTVL
jgi:uncharacterized OsmC-like protein